MKILSFSATEILPSLLDKSKTQTIRPAWKELKFTEDKPYITNKRTIIGVDGLKDGTKAIMVIDKKPRFKVKEKVKLMWKQRSKYTEFCKRCGAGVVHYPSGYEHGKKEYALFRCVPLNFEVFPKTLGEAEITEMFEVEMSKTFSKEFHDNDITLPILVLRWKIEGALHEWRLDGRHEREVEEVLRDGFENRVAFVNWFDEKYDLSQPKRFFVYRWRWI